MDILPHIITIFVGKIIGSLKKKEFGLHSLENVLFQLIIILQTLSTKYNLFYPATVQTKLCLAASDKKITAFCVEYLII
jgi:hypothetical protein